jgi:short-subunit dehydrogenase
VADTVSELQQTTRGSVIGAYTHDLSSMKGAYALAESVQQEWELDVLVNNAAVFEEDLR